MPPFTRSKKKTAEINGFPDITHDGDGKSEKERPISVIEAASDAEVGYVRSSPEPDVTPEEIEARGIEPPIYTIDLSLPPEQRYVQVASDYKETLKDLTFLFEDILEYVRFPRLVDRLSRVFLRRLHSHEQTEELRGISKATGLDMYLLVAYNVLLDSLMGCTSGGVQVQEGKGKEKKMLHFRTLDWGMEELRQAIVQFDYVNKPGGKVIARTVGYAGYVGVVTGVRQGLSISLNFRPYHNDSTSKRSNLKFYAHLALVSLGFRPSISAHLRSLIFASKDPIPSKEVEKAKPKCSQHLQNLTEIIQHFPQIPTTAAYLIFSDGSQTVVMEKDRITARINASSQFIAATNHDAGVEHDTSSIDLNHIHHFGLGMQDILDESMDRKGHVVARWEKKCREWREKHSPDAAGNEDVCVTEEELKDWLLQYPVTNQETHFATIMDPGTGEVRWVRAWEEPAVVVGDEDSEGDDYSEEDEARGEDEGEDGEYQHAVEEGRE